MDEKLQFFREILEKMGYTQEEIQNIQILNKQDRKKEKCNNQTQCKKKIDSYQKQYCHKYKELLETLNKESPRGLSKRLINTKNQLELCKDTRIDYTMNCCKNENGHVFTDLGHIHFINKLQREQDELENEIQKINYERRANKDKIKAEKQQKIKQKTENPPQKKKKKSPKKKFQKKSPPERTEPEPLPLRKPLTKEQIIEIVFDKQIESLREYINSYSLTGLVGLDRIQMKEFININIKALKDTFKKAKKIKMNGEIIGLEYFHFLKTVLGELFARIIFDKEMVNYYTNSFYNLFVKILEK